MSRRDLILEEMGITPVWRLREQGNVETAPADATSQPVPVREGGAAGPSGTAEAAAVAAEVMPPVVEHVADAPRAGASGEPGAVAPNEEPRVSVPSMPSATDRRTVILQMDWAGLRAAVDGCTACALHVRRNKTVFGVGDERASWLFVGEGPGADEDAKGEPFVGQAGRLLDNMIAAIGLKRGEDVYIANVVKCRPPNNRNPESGEMSCCEPYLARQIELIKPRLIVAMGKIAACHLLQTEAAVAALRGRVHKYRGTPLIVTYHPAYLLRTLPDKSKAWTDLCFARDRMDAIVAAAGKSQGEA